MLVFFSLTNFFSVGKPSQKCSKSKKSHRKTIKAINASLNYRRTIFFCFIQVFFSRNLPCKAPQIIQCNLDILSKKVHSLQVYMQTFTDTDSVTVFEFVDRVVVKVGWIIMHAAFLRQHGIIYLVTSFRCNPREDPESIFEISCPISRSISRKNAGL